MFSSIFGLRSPIRRADTIFSSFTSLNFLLFLSLNSPILTFCFFQYYEPTVLERNVLKAKGRKTMFPVNKIFNGPTHIKPSSYSIFNFTVYTTAAISHIKSNSFYKKTICNSNTRCRPSKRRRCIAPINVHIIS